LTKVFSLPHHKKGVVLLLKLSLEHNKTLVHILMNSMSVKLMSLNFFIYTHQTMASTNKIDHHDITEILLKLALNTITLTLTIADYNIKLTTLT
jgi:hypothetical protein